MSFNQDPFDDFFGSEDPFHFEMLLVFGIAILVILLAVVL